MIFMQLSQHSSTSSRKKVEMFLFFLAANEMTTTNMFFMGALCQNRDMPEPSTGRFFISSPLKWAEQTGPGAFTHSLLAGAHETT